MVIDLVKRFSLTPQVAVFPLNGSLLRVASNSQLLLDRLQAESTASRADIRNASIMDWRIVVEGEQHASGGDFAHHGFKHDGLSFIRIANESFLAFDRLLRIGISFITANLIEEEGLFNEHFMPALTSILDQMKEEA